MSAFLQRPFNAPLLRELTVGSRSIDKDSDCYHYINADIISSRVLLEALAESDMFCLEDLNILISRIEGDDEISLLADIIRVKSSTLSHIEIGTVFLSAQAQVKILTRGVVDAAQSSQYKLDSLDFTGIQCRTSNTTSMRGLLDPLLDASVRVQSLKHLSFNAVSHGADQLSLVSPNALYSLLMNGHCYQLRFSGLGFDKYTPSSGQSTEVSAHPI